MITDPIIEELYEIRDRLAAELNYDVFAIAADARERQFSEGRPVVSFEQEAASVVNSVKAKNEIGRKAA